MAKKIIILDKTEAGRFRYVLWADVPILRQSMYASPGASSAFKNASAAELDALKNGSVVEMSDVLAIDNLTIPTAQIELQKLWTEFQNRINAHNPWNRYGSFWDGAAWTAGGIS